MRDLYPPILPSYIPAFSYNDGSVNIYFALSHYNSFSQFKSVQLTIRYQGNNASALKDDYPIDIITLTKQGPVDDINSEYPYYVTLKSSVLKNGFEPGAFYKVQIRLISTAATEISEKTTANQVNSNLNNFSEWSTVCILKAIAPPTVAIKEFDTEGGGSSGSTVSTEYNMVAGDAVFSGSYKYGEYIKTGTTNTKVVESDETPSTWRMKLYLKQEKDNYKLIGDSKEQIFNVYDYTNTSSDAIPFKYDFQVQLIQDQQYKFYYNVTTRNGYVIERSYEFNVTQAMHKLFEPSTFTAEINNDEAYIKIHLTNATVGSYILTLRRSSSESNFERWEDITNITVVNKEVDVYFYDYAIKSGVVYRYGVQSRDNGYRRSVLDTSDYFVMGDFEYSYLLEHNEGLSLSSSTLPEVTQLKLMFDVNISSFGNTLIESKMDTIGSKYPFITRNGDVNYRTFPIAGLISYHMNEVEDPGKGFSGLTPRGGDNTLAPYYKEGSYTSRKDIYGESLDLIDERETPREYLHKPIMADKDTYSAIADNPSVQYDSFYDYNYEREFREKVMEFLYNGKPKLFKSATEGNILIRLMDVSFTPKQELGRLVYEFSATAYEIDEPTLDNLNKYNIQNIKPYEKIVDETYTYLGQLNYWDLEYDNVFYINNAIKNKHHIDTGEIWNGMQYSNGFLSYLKITFESAPYLIDREHYTPYDYNADPYKTTEKNKDNLIMGWLINYGTDTILVSYPNNIYEFKDDNVQIDLNTNMSFPKKTEAIIDYLVRVQQKPVDAARVAKSIEIKHCLGQLYDTFNPYDNFANMINMRYIEKNNSKEVVISGYQYLDIEADPGTVFYLQQGDALGELRRFVLNFTGRLLIRPDDSTVVYTRGYFVGKNITQKQLQTYRNLGTVTDFPVKPRELDYCTKDNEMYIFYQQEWRTLTPVTNEVMLEPTYDIQCPVKAIVDYFIYKEEAVYE